jgi:hypothetical protein
MPPLLRRSGYAKAKEAAEGLFGMFAVIIFHHIFA